MHVAAKGVGHRFGDAPWLFRDVTVDLCPGSVYALSGPSGSGKSTLLSLLARLEEPLEGRIEFNNVRRISWVFQNPFGVPRRSALDHVMLPLLGAGASLVAAEKEGRELLSRFALEPLADRSFRELSGGEAQRLMLARGLAARPSLLLVDEPTAQLDRRTAAQVDAVIGATANEHTIVVVATHDEHTRQACDVNLDLSDVSLSGVQ